MMSSRPQGAKKPSGGRPLPRRLFSLDSLRKEKSTDSDKSAQEESTSKRVETSILEDPEDPFTDDYKGVISPGRRGASGALNVMKEGSITSPNASDLTVSLDESEQTTRTPSRRRWDTLRMHVLPTVSSDAEIPSVPSTPTEFTHPYGSPGQPPRPSTPKRFGQRKVFRQVVDQARAVDESRKLADDIQRACWHVRFAEPPQRPKVERDAYQATTGSGLSLPFMSSTTSVPISASSSTVGIPATNKTAAAFRRPQSVHSLSSSGVVKASVTHVARALTSTTSVHRPRDLPHESHILSALLVPFVSPNSRTQVEEERAIAVETFEYTVRTWRASSDEAELERCLWCCRAASVASYSRSRILATLSSILFSKDSSLTLETPVALQTLLQAIFSLICSLSPLPTAASEVTTLLNHVAVIRSGSCGTLSPPDVEREYGVRFSKADNERSARDAIATESLVKCLESGPDDNRRWFLRNLLETQWPLPEPNLTLTPLLACIHWRKLKSFIHSVIALLSTPSATAEVDREVIVRVFRTRVLPEVEAMREEDASEIQHVVVRLVLELLCVREGIEREYVMMHFCDWYQHHAAWKSSIESTIQQIIRDAEWAIILRLIPMVLREVPNDVQTPMTSFVLPLINERLIVFPPKYPCLALSHFLQDVSRAHPKVFFKPLFACAAATREATVAKQLCTVHAIVKFIPDFWMRDPEMISVALMSDTKEKAKAQNENAGPRWGKARLGQLVIFVELIEHLRNVRNVKDVAVAASATKFFIALEARLGVVIDLKERTTLVPESQRVLLCALFREIRLLTRSLKPATWLAPVVSWTLVWRSRTNEVDDIIARDDEQEAADIIFNKLLTIYAQCQEALRGSNKLSAASSNGDGPSAIENPFGDRIKTLTAMSLAPKAATLNLLVSMSGLLTSDDYSKLGPVLWTQCMDEKDATVAAPACFLIMQCAEKTPLEFEQLVMDDLSSVDSRKRRLALLKMGALSSWRFQILSQDVILDRTHRRPFKLARPPLSFVATDIGSSSYIYEEDPNEYKDSNGPVLPLELRRRLSEMGWAEEDQNVDPHRQWIRTPMSLLPSQQLSYLDGGSDDLLQLSEHSRDASPSPEPSPTKTSSDSSLLRRDSSTSGRSRGVKRRPVLVPAIVSLFPQLACLISDPDFTVSSAAQDLMVDFMRDDPTVLARTVFTLISGDEPSLLTAISTLRAFLHVRHVLPPAMAHHVLNHLTGFLKSSMRHPETSMPLESYAYSMAILSKLITQVSNMSVQDIRRAKVDMFLFPSGALWFPASAPIGPFFPKELMAVQSTLTGVPPSLVSITLIRTAQNMLFRKILMRNHGDFKAIRKHMLRLVLPSLHQGNEHAPRSLADLIPRRQRRVRPDMSPSTEATLTALSLTLARSYLLLVRQIFQSMSRHLSDRDELAMLIDGLNAILLAHGDDIGIVAHTMLALMTASTRFRRMFTSKGGYTLFMPAVIKAHVEAEYHPGIRAAIEYAAARFYALHEESFIFQSIDSIAKIVTLPDADGQWIAGGIYELFSSLKTAVPSTTVDAAGIYGLNKPQEQEALLLTAVHEVPQKVLASLRGEGNRNLPVELPALEEYESKPFGMDNFVRLFLTVIAHNPTIQRAEQFLRLFRLLVPNLYHASSSTRTVLREGIDALGSILLMKPSGKTKLAGNSQPGHLDKMGYEASTETKAPTGHSQTQVSASSDLHSMRVDYLSLVVAFTVAGGQFNYQASQRIMELVKTVLKDSRSSADYVATFLSGYMRAVLIRDPPPGMKQVITLLNDVVPVVSAYNTTVDFSGVYDVLTELAGNPVFASERSFAQIIVTQYCRIGLDACEVAASENLLFSLPLRVSLVKLLNSAVCLVEADVIAELERHSPTHSMLAGVVLPFALTLRTSKDIMADSQSADSWRRDVHSRTWVHLLSYLLTTFQQADHPDGLRRKFSVQGVERRKSQDKRSSTLPEADAQAVMTFTVALQALKVIVTRAEDDISTTIPGIWAHVGGILKARLADGDASFAVKSLDVSEPSSPLYSPKAGSYSEQQLQTPFAFPTSISMQSHRRLSPPRVIDYLTWSFIQWLSLRRSPLMIQMRIFIQEKVATLSQDLSQQDAPVSAVTHRGRRISSIFSKPRRSPMVNSAASSAASSPRNSFQQLNTSVSLPAFSELSPNLGPSISRKDNVRQAGFSLAPSPVSPTRRNAPQTASGRKIVHLGPLSSSSALNSVGMPRSASPSGQGRRSHTGNRDFRAMAKDMTIQSPSLVRMTYRRIRLVQHLMGYRELLPLGHAGGLGGFGEGDEDDDPDEGVRAWTKIDALEAIVQETRDLMEEFRGDEDELGDESAVWVDPVDSQTQLLI